MPYTNSSRHRVPLAIRTVALAAAAVLLARPHAAHAQPTYDPLRITSAASAPPLDLDIVDGARKRTIPVRVYRPAGNAQAPVVLFSHGLGGSRENNAYLGTHWASRGYVAVFMQHAGSDEAVWKDVPARSRLREIRSAASAKSYLDRNKDVTVVIDALTRWNTESGHALRGKLDMNHVGMSGHSFGAVTTQAVSGQSLGRGRTPYLEPRIDAALLLSPSVPERVEAADAFGTVRLPWLLMTGTKDASPINNTTVEDRTAVYPALPPGSKYEVVLFNAEHSAFGDASLRGDREPRNPNHHRVVQALSTAFWDAYLKNDSAARAWLDGPAALSVMEQADRWQRK